jgi:hypothetical protein
MRSPHCGPTNHNASSQRQAQTSPQLRALGLNQAPCRASTISTSLRQGCSPGSRCIGTSWFGFDFRHTYLVNRHRQPHRTPKSPPTPHTRTANTRIPHHPRASILSCLLQHNRRVAFDCEVRLRTHLQRQFLQPGPSLPGSQRRPRDEDALPICIAAWIPEA